MILPNKICLFVPSLGGGGAERMIVTLANGFAGRGYAVDLVLAQAKGHFLQQVSSKVRIIDLNVSRTFKSLFGLVRYLRRERPAVILSTLSNANVVMLIAGRLSGATTRIVVREACTIPPSEHTSFSYKVIIALMRLTYPFANQIIAISKGVAQDLIENFHLPEKKIRVIYNPTIGSDFILKTKERINHPWFQPGEPPVIIGVGRLTIQKDFPTLIRAFAKTRKTRNIRLVIFGEGDDCQELNCLAKSLNCEAHVAFLGFVENPYPYMCASALFVMSSRWEGFGNVLVEAMACGIRVISTDCPSGPREILEGGRWGALVRVGDSVALAEAITLQLDSQVPIGMLESVMNRFHEERIIEQYLDVLVVGR